MPLENEPFTQSDPEDETALIRLASQGEGKAFALLYQRYIAPLSSYIRQQVDSQGGYVAADVDELAQEVFTRAYRALSGSDQGVPERSFKTWLYTIARKVFIAQRPKRSLNPGFNEYSLEDEEWEHAQAVMQGYGGEELWRRLVDSPSERGEATVVYQHSHEVNSVAWSPDGKYIASANGDSTVSVLDASHGDVVQTYHKDASRSYSYWFNDLAWSPDSKRIATASTDGMVLVWDAPTGSDQYIYPGHVAAVWAVAWSPDGSRIASAGDDRTVQVWDATAGSTIYTFHGHLSPVYGIAWSPDGQRIASASADETVQVWDAYSGEHLYTYCGHRKPVQAVKWSPDGKWIASASMDGTVQIWQASTGVLLYTYYGHVRSVLGLAWSPDSQRIVSGSQDGTVQIWQIDRDRETAVRE